MEGTDGNHMNTDEEVLEVGAGDVQDTGGSAGSGLQSGLGQGMATEGDDEKAQDIDDEEEVESEEGRKGQAMPTPMTVSRKEREEHELTHLPYRSWCAHCVRGRGRNMPHKHLGGKRDPQTMVPRVSLDYFFLTNKDTDKNKKDKEEEETNLHPHASHER